MAERKKKEAPSKPQPKIKCAAYGIYGDENIGKLERKYANNISKFYEDIKSDPYGIFINVLGYSFKYADEIIIKRKLAAPDSRVRCRYAVIAGLKANEQQGNTRMQDTELARFVNNVAHDAMPHIVDIVSNDPLIHYEKNRHLVSLEHTWQAEQNISDCIKKRLKRHNIIDIDVEKYRNVDGIELTDEQLSAVKMAADNGVCMLNGCAGVGKSLSTRAIVNMLEDAGMSYALLAPTGIASKVLRQYTHRPASTIHMFLTNPWSPDYILVDESGMVAVHLLSILFHEVGDKSNFIFVADNAQLASISCGSIVQDMIDSGIVPRTQLTKIFRYNSSGIVTIATDMRHGDSSHLTDNFPDYLFVPADDNGPIEQVVGVYDELLAQGYGMDDILVLCPFNKNVGADAINKLISDKYNHNEPVRKNSAIKVGDKVINIKNDYSGGVDDMIANGDMGYLVHYSYDHNHKHYDIRVQFEDGVKPIKSLQVLKQAYATSIHRVQGSSAKVVVLLVHRSHGFFLSSNLLYTAVTRAREKLIVIGDEDAIKRGLEIQQNEERDTWLKEMLDNGTSI